jgi:hypothetical protein
MMVHKCIYHFGPLDSQDMWRQHCGSLPIFLVHLFIHSVVVVTIPDAVLTIPSIPKLSPKPFFYTTRECRSIFIQESMRL